MLGEICLKDFLGEKSVESTPLTVVGQMNLRLGTHNR